MALAVEWVSKITVVALEMVLPGLAGHWLDGRLRTKFLAMTGFAIGIVCGMWHLLVMTGAVGRKNTNDKPPSKKDSRQ